MLFIKANASSNSGSRGYTRAAIQQAMNSGMTREQATRLVNRNAATTNQRVSPRSNFVNRLPAGTRGNIAR